MGGICGRETEVRWLGYKDYPGESVDFARLRHEDGFEPVVDVGAALGLMAIAQSMIAGDVGGEFKGE